MPKSNSELAHTTAASGAGASLAPSDGGRRGALGELRPGDLIAGKYRFDGVLGAGGMGLVLRAAHVELNRPVAIKVVRDELVGDEEVVARMLAEAETAASLRSEHAARVLDLGRLDSGVPYIVFEYLEGRDLATVLQEHGPLVPEIAVDFVLHACDALAEAHAAGIVHRDLKPDNLFLTRRPDGSPLVKVLDFGVCKRLSTGDRCAVQTSPAQIIGTPCYMAPEQMRGGGPVDARADLWALGVVLYELCTGRTPFEADTFPSVCAKVLDGDPLPPRALARHLPRGLERVILRCLRKQPSRRYQSVPELGRALGRFGSPRTATYVERLSATTRAGAPAAELTGTTQRSAGTVPPPELSLAPTARVPDSGAPRRRRRIPSGALVFAGATGLSLLSSTALFEIRARTAKNRPETATAARSVRAEPVLATSFGSGALRKPEPTATPVCVPVLAASSSATAAPSATRSAPPLIEQHPPAHGRAKERRAPTAEPKRLDPWDPRNFGGRR